MNDKKSPGDTSGKDKWKKFAEDTSPAEEEPAAEAPKESDLSLEFPDRKKLEQQLTDMEQQVDEYKDKHLRLLAQLKNVQERSERDVSNAHKYGSEKLLSDLLPVVDSLVRGLESSQSDDANTQLLREGMQLTLDLLTKTLKKHGVEVIAPQAGDKFNPNLHEAVSVQPNPEVESNAVIRTIMQGYSLNGRVVRAAMVIVAS